MNTLVEALNEKLETLGYNESVRNTVISKMDISLIENKLNDAYEVAKSTIDINTLYSDIEEVVNDGTRKVKLELTFDNESDYMNIKLVSEIKTITPGLNLIIGYPYKVTTERVIKYVKQ